MMPQRYEPHSQEYFYDGLPMITETDIGGRITYVNRKFEEMSGYKRVELIGRSHSIIRHPEMPASCFRLMWQTLQEGLSWQGYVKNLRKDGNFYWVIVHIAPIHREMQNGFIAARKKPDLKMVSQIEDIYWEARNLEQRGKRADAESLVLQTARVDALGFPLEMLG